MGHAPWGDTACICAATKSLSWFQNLKHMPEIKTLTVPEIHKQQVSVCLYRESAVMYFDYKIANNCGVETFLKLPTYRTLHVRAISKTQKPKELVGESC